MSLEISKQENFEKKNFKSTIKTQSKKPRKGKNKEKEKKTNKKNKEKRKSSEIAKNKKKIPKSESTKKKPNGTQSVIRNDPPRSSQREIHPLSQTKKHNQEISQKSIIISSPQKNTKKKKKKTKKDSKNQKDVLKIRKSPATRSTSFPNRKGTPIKKRNRQSSMLPNSNQSQSKIVDLLRRQISKKQTKLQKLQHQLQKIEKERNSIKEDFQLLNNQRHKLLCSKCIREKVYLESEKIDQIAQQQCKKYICNMEKGVQILERIKDRNEQDEKLLKNSQKQFGVIQRIGK
ncbi:hypothetical protein M0813_10502 [Anaeramoeba flamelloides]|uniref:Uncharacterized protein n=1 Tax=Anaeramoeba flamelloides TaxID=1746091 RepID=A0ABQ8X6V7_9EUKA|nr:hypothetical protein M0813_10502 [Anaeramoeba flamelloides]